MACRFFQSSQGCFRGASCSFRHDGEPSSSNDDVELSPANPYANGAIPSPGQPRPCRFFSSPFGCRNGSSCQFVHVAAAPSLEVADFYEELNPPLPPVVLESNGAVFYNHPGIPPPMMLPAEPVETDKAEPPRRKLQIQANPQKKETISEILPVLTRDIEGPVRRRDAQAERKLADFLYAWCCSSSLLTSSVSLRAVEPSRLLLKVEGYRAAG
jgi:hypothetical protein